MPRPVCYTSSSIGPCPTLCNNFDVHDETVSITWDDGFNFQDTSWLKVYHSVEVPDFLPGAVERFLANKDFYDVVLAWDERILHACPKAVFCTESACSWLPRKADGPVDPLGTMNHGGTLHKNPVSMNYPGCDVSAKKFAVSFLTSSKRQFPGHVLRQEIFDRLPERVGELATWKHRSPPIVDDKRTVMEPYMFSIVPENTKHNGYYTEKVVDCLVAKTIPIYWGCPNFSAYFNMEGVVTFENYSDLENKLLSLTPEFYRSRAGAIEDNFQRALRGVHQWDLIEAAITEGIQRKHQTEMQGTPVSTNVIPSRRLLRPNRRPNV